MGLDTLQVLLAVHLCAGVADDLDVFGEESIAEESEESGEGLLLCEIARGAQDDDDCVFLELLGAAGEKMSVEAEGERGPVGERRLNSAAVSHLPGVVARLGLDDGVGHG